MEVVSVEVEGVKVKGAGGVAGSKGSGSATSGGTSSSSAAADVVSKRRKMDVRNGNGGECGDASGDSACVVHCGRFKVAAVEFNLPTAVDHFGAPVGVEENGERCLSGDEEDPGTASCCCSSNERSESVDLEVKSGEVDASTIQSRYRRERTPRRQAVGTESDDNEENNRPKPPAVVAATAGNSHQRHLLVRMSLRAEIEDFFSTEEKKAALHFKEKYNFDFEKEEPSRGRYEWKPFASVAASAPVKEKEIIKA